MTKPIYACLCGIVSLITGLQLHAQSDKIAANFQLIAHRGGVVDSATAENSLQALEKAIARGYDRIEIDVRMSKDSVFIIHHDRNFLRYYGIDTPVSELAWPAMKALEGSLGNRVHTLEEVLAAAQNRIKVMIDLKVPGNDTLLHGRLIQLLSRYDQLSDALLIGTDESTDYYRGKIALSCTRQQLEANRKRPGYSPAHYYLFSGTIRAADVEWATQHGIRVIGVINASPRQHDPLSAGKAAAGALKAAGVRIFQIDSLFDPFFREPPVR
ncbi:glycerophosphodiester phosphodiesterase [Parapedobacter koreensis]|uniref:Glycerophosphoryl diester phosphodiesterase family protein n=1 Tax=Parapedobacter koreensis TaxID=332977 RepID=A0A1H7NS75_9SPHI|nr:glycerophosphodiester phosphodiesterase family protein [Parapedobacter koreensis]SEL26383.1 Glycerophosphoryl diester phosphodiesterase family protein [Parapedobacter koreensis]